MGNMHLDEEAIFDVARQIPTVEGRQTYLAQVCGDNTALLARVEALLHIHDEEQDFLQSPPVEPGATVAPAMITEQAGQQIGRYKLLQQIGEGGFGVVYMSEQQEPVRRKVALKIIKPGMDTKEVIARFQAEQQALALMDHPNIARVFDAGVTETGRPYFVMELVKGIPITEYCDQSNLNPEERLELFVAVCQAVHHAHQKGVIHRDVKPSNILITLHDGKPVVKVIDFGVAKAINQRLTERTLFTKFAQLVGTPMYMSPEQAEMSGLDVDTRTDIYSLGVVLYELLTGSTPFEKTRLHDASYDEIRRIIRDEEPPRPSTRVSTLGKAATTISERRRTEPRKLSALLKGDLDWIVMKALEKDRTRRYDTAKDLADDVLRYLHNEPVEASPPSAWYRVRKFARRNRLAIRTTAVVAFLAVASLASGSLLMTQRENAREVQIERDRERQEREKEKEFEMALPEIERLRDQEQFVTARAMALKWQEPFPQHSKLQELVREVSCTWSVFSDPPGARVTRTLLDFDDANEEEVGVTPLDRAVLARGVFRYRVAKEGYETVEGLAGPGDVVIRRTLGKHGEHSGMVPVESTSASGQKTAFWIDRFEVTNREFKEFVDKGAYGDRNYWKEPLILEDRQLSFEEAIQQFTDSTGKPGPSTWTNGTYPPGEDDVPVRGVSWYEAAAYAEFRGKSLPTLNDWERAASFEQSAWIVSASNFSGKGPAKVGACPGIGFFGVYDMAGNVKEWCWNRGANQRRCMIGGAWDEPSYMFHFREAYLPLDRQPTFGFRCAKYLASRSVEDLADTEVGGSTQVRLPDPLSPKELDRLMAVFRYDRQAPLNSKTTSVDVSAPDYRHETIEIDTAYGGGRLTLHLLLPKQAQERLQPIVFFPGIGAIQLKRFADGLSLVDGLMATDLVATGRAVCWPVYAGTFERNDGFIYEGNTLRGLESTKRQVMDLCRAVDYLETRPEFDMGSLTFLGFSWGANIGPMMVVAEPRMRAAVLVSGGLVPGGPPETDPASYAPFVKVPTLMINGRSDHVPYQDAMLSFLGSSDKSRQFLGEGHIPPMMESNKRLVEWLAERFGSAKASPVSLLQRADRAVQVADSLIAEQGYAGEAEIQLRDALGILQRELGEDHPKTLNVNSRLATVVEQQNRDDEAFDIFQLTWQKQRDVLGKNHADTLQTAKHFAELCWKTAWNLNMRRSATDEERDRAVELTHRALDLDPNGTAAWCVAHIADCRGALKETDKQLDGIREALAIFERAGDVDGQWHMWMRLGSTLRAQGVLLDAKDAFSRALELSNHREVMSIGRRDQSASHLSEVLFRLRDWQAAEKVHHEFILFAEPQLDTSDSRLWDHRTLLVCALAAQGKEKEAESIRQGLVSSTDPKSQWQMWIDLGTALSKLGRLFDAKDAFGRALELSEGLGEQRIERQIQSARRLCGVLGVLRDWHTSEVIARQNLQLEDGQAATNLADVIFLQDHLAMALDAEEKKAEAQAVRLEMLSIVERARKEGHGVFPGGCGNAILYADVLSSTHNDEATLQESLRILKETPPDPSTFARFWWHQVCAEIHKRLGKNPEAVQHMLISLDNVSPEDLAGRHYGEEWLTRLYRDAGQFQEAETVLRKALADNMQRLGDDHVITQYACVDLAQLLMELKKYAEAEALLGQAQAGLLSDTSVPSSQKQRVIRLLGDVCEASGKPEEALQWRTKLEPSPAPKPVETGSSAAT